MRISPLTRAGLVLGFGLGGLLNGIVLFQVLGWHHLFGPASASEQTSLQEHQWQSTQDGLFQTGVWGIGLLGVVMLFRAARQSTQRWSANILTGAMLTGWGAFTVLEGVINHHLLGLHHVLPGEQDEWLLDLIYLAAGLGLAVYGWVVVKTPARVRPASPPESDAL